MKRTVLSIEDTAGIRRLIRLTLEYEGFDVVEADDGRHGLDLARQILPDLILLDVRMPGLSGLEACSRLRADTRLKNIPVVMLSAYDGGDEVQAGLDAGADAYIVKPFQPLALIDLVNDLITRSQPH